MIASLPSAPRWGEHGLIITRRRRKGRAVRVRVVSLASSLDHGLNAIPLNALEHGREDSPRLDSVCPALRRVVEFLHDLVAMLPSSRRSRRASICKIASSIAVKIVRPERISREAENGDDSQAREPPPPLRPACPWPGPTQVCGSLSRAKVMGLAQPRQRFAITRPASNERKANAKVGRLAGESGRQVRP